MVYFSEVEPIDLYFVNWNIRYNRNNQTYQMLISVCYLVVKGLLQTNSDGNVKLMDFLDEQRMRRLYEKTDEAVIPDNRYLMSGNKISVRTLDLNCEFEEIASQLNRIAEEHFCLESGRYDQ